MESKELYQCLLGLSSPWTVGRVELDMAKQRVDVHVEHPKGSRFGCPECGQELPVYDHHAERVWRHLDSCQFLTYLHASPPRVDCPAHGVRQARLPWAEAGSRFTHLFEVLAIDMLKAANVKQAAAILRLSWDEAWGLMQRAACYWGHCGHCVNAEPKLHLFGRYENDVLFPRLLGFHFLQSCLLQGVLFDLK